MSEKSLVYAIRSDVTGNVTAAGLTKELGKALKPIEVNTDILAGLEQKKRLEFMKQWQAALKRWEREPDSALVRRDRRCPGGFRTAGAYPIPEFPQRTVLQSKRQ